jgi:murein DD-endopeptidase MepM/ murein hydrolase activator NlpD
VRTRLHGPQTIAGLAQVSAALGLSLFLALFGLSAWSRGGEEPALSPVDLSGLGLQFPVPAVSANAMSNSFADRRGQRTHHAVDIFAPRYSFVVAVDDGTVAQLSRSSAGGISVYQFDAAERYCYFYAHLDGYAPGLAEGQLVKRGQVLGFVGTTGNAPAKTPHLHFAIALVASPKQWWGGSPIDPFPIWKERGEAAGGTERTGAPEKAR